MAFSWSVGSEQKKSSAGGTKPKAKGFSWSLSGQEKPERRPSGSGPKSTDEKLSDVEGAAEEAGYHVPGPLKSLGMGALDLLSRGNYAAAGAAEELFTERGGGPLAALKRAGREVFSGVGGIRGDKEGFGQVLEQSGVGTGGSLSDIAPILFNDTGEGLQFKRGGWADPTARGAGGLALDIVADPLNLVTLGGGKGLQIAGKAVPGTARAAAAVSRSAKAVTEAVPLFDDAINAVGGIFNRDWKIRNLPGAIRLKQAHLNRQRAAVENLHETLGKSAIAAIPKSKWAEFVDAVDNGTAMNLYADNPKMLKAVEEANAFNQGFATNEIAGGLLKPEQVRTNYIGHFYENSPKELNKAYSVWPSKKQFDQASLGRHQEVRAFNTLKEAEDWSKTQHALDKTVPILKPLRDPLEIMRRRGEASIEALEFRQFYDEIIDRYGRRDIPLNPEDFEELRHAWPVADSEAAKIGTIAAAGKNVPRHALEGLSENGRKELIRQTLLKADSPEEVLKMMNKFGVGDLPEQANLVGKIAEDGTPYKSVKLGHRDAVIPLSLAEDLGDMSERVIKSKELDHMLRYYDKINNTFKSFVTVPFPSFHFRNAYSNMALAFADVGASVLNPARHFDAISAMRGAEGALVTKAGESIPYKQLQKEMVENGVTQKGRNLLEYTGQQGIDRLSTVGGKVKSAPRRFGQGIENEARAALYTVYRRRGMDVATAADRVNQFLFDYTNLSQVEQQFFKRAIPFYTFARKNLERQFRNITTKPGLTAAELKTVRGRPEENENMTSWEGNAFKFRLNKDGNTLTTLSGVDLPVRQLDLIWRGSVESTARQSIGMLSPFLQAPLVAAFGQVPFTGRSTERAESQVVGRIVEKMPDSMQKWIGYKKDTDKAGRTHYTFQGDRFYALFQSWALSRIVSTTDRQFRKYADDPSWGPVILDTMTGLRYNEMNMDEEKQKMYQERLKYLEKWGRGKGFLREYQRTYAPKETQ